MGEPVFKPGHSIDTSKPFILHGKDVDYLINPSEIVYVFAAHPEWYKKTFIVHPANKVSKKHLHDLMQMRSKQHVTNIPYAVKNNSNKLVAVVMRQKDGYKYESLYVYKL